MQKIKLRIKKIKGKMKIILELMAKEFKKIEENINFRGKIFFLKKKKKKKNLFNFV